MWIILACEQRITDGFTAVVKTGVTTVNVSHSDILTSNLCVCLCLSSAGINESYQMGLFQVLAAILHLGNVEIKDRDSDSSLIPVRITFINQY